MGQLVSTSITVRRFLGTAAAIGLLAACTASSSNAGFRHQGSDSQAATRQVACQPQVRLLPTRTATESSEATAINDNGWVAGSLATPRTKPPSRSLAEQWSAPRPRRQRLAR
jgi:hypothetical protein